MSCPGRFARPYRKILAVYLIAILASALLGLVPPLVVRRIIDTAIPREDRGMITLLAVMAVLAAVGDAALNVVQRWCGSSSSGRRVGWGQAAGP